MRSLPPLPSTRTQPVVEVEVAAVEADELADAHPRSRTASRGWPGRAAPRASSPGDRASRASTSVSDQRLRDPLRHARRARPPRSGRVRRGPRRRRSGGTIAPRPAPARSTTARSGASRRRRAPSSGTRRTRDGRLADRVAGRSDPGRAGTPRSGAGRGGTRRASSRRARARRSASCRARRAALEFPSIVSAVPGTPRQVAAGQGAAPMMVLASTSSPRRDELVDVGERDPLDRHRRLLDGRRRPGPPPRGRTRRTGTCTRRRTRACCRTRQRHQAARAAPDLLVELALGGPLRRLARRRRACPPAPRAGRCRPRPGTGARAATVSPSASTGTTTTAPGWLRRRRG